MSGISIMEDVISLVTLRLFAKRKKGEISNHDFEIISDMGYEKMLNIVAVRSNSKHFEEMVNEEIRKAVELISSRSCGRCKGGGFSQRFGPRLVICPCCSMVRYRGDSTLPVGEQYSNQYFTGEFSKDQLGKRDTVKYIAMAVSLVLLS